MNRSQRVAFGVKVKRLQVPFRANELSVALTVGVVDLYVDFPGCVLRGVKHINIGACVVDDRFAVGSRKPDVEVSVVCMLLETAARRCTRV